MTTWKNNNTLESRRLVEEVLGSTEGPEKVVARDEEHLKWIIKERVLFQGPNCDLNDIDVSHVTYMDGLFKGSKFNGDISQWDVSNVIDMSYMFKDSEFNGDISGWDVSRVADMNSMFEGSQVKDEKKPDWYNRRV